MTISGEIGQWATWMTAANNRPDTIAQRIYHVSRMLKETRGDPWVLTSEDLVSWLGSKGWKPNTLRAYRASFRAFYTWGQGVGRRPDNPALLIPRVRVPRGLPRPTPELVYRTAAIGSNADVRLMIYLAAICGLRRGEISRVCREDIVEDLLGFALRIEGKGGHVRLVPLPDELAAMLRARPAGWIFPSPRRPGPLTPAHVGKLVSQALPDHWTCHTLRHRCGTVAYSTTKDLRAVQELLGHMRPETTALYTQVGRASIREAIRGTAA